MLRYAPSQKLSPTNHKKFNILRLNIDIIGLALTRLSLPITAMFPGWLQQVFSIYNIMALITILTLDPTRLPEATTTRYKQKQSWLEMIKILPLLAVLFGAIAWAFHLPLRHQMFPSIGAVVFIYMDELLFRNIIQPKLRMIGLPSYMAIGGQSFIYAAVFLLMGAPLGAILIAYLLGLCNGWIVYKNRSLWPAFVLSFAVHAVFLGYSTHSWG